MSELQTPPVPRRNMELLLLLLALFVSLAAYYLVGLNTDVGFDQDFLVQGGILAGLALMVHVSLRIWAKYADPVILPSVVALNGIGLAMIHRIDISKGSTVAFRQLLWTGVAIVVAIVVLWAIRDHRTLGKFTYIALLVSVVLLLLPMVPGLGHEVYGARIWIKIGSMTFQPGEIAKITLAIFFAGYLSSNRDLILMAGRKIGPLQLPRARDLAPMIVAWLVSIGVLVMQRDLGSSILLFGLFLVIIYVATGRISWIVIGMVFVTVGGIFAYQTMAHVTRRIDGWLNAFDPNVYYAKYGSAQIVEGLFGLANGGLLGTGLGNGRPGDVPLANSDMIIASLGEELGLIGLSAIVLLYVILVSRGLRAALGARDTFGKLLATGLSFTLALQCFVVIGGVTRLIPLTGLTTPFMAAGGSSLLANWIIVALLLMISHNARRPIAVNPSATGEVATAAPGKNRLRKGAKA
ncbi:FtsW/RodA/SpoVE family cell cycle protein [Paeniglutamicibacter cryotolerans]|uniref:Cell division protein FtsW (Lipid II flippase) n=1 Tax=Paeniglutamicibacter cryotolerans TaxID=670079 RepID=A0A839QK79_9MICC|nr:FtsW/RodA/SpoVE family cell cycle protein [Paeniglutamicibacter cryotolerans]MBB2994965.1 cell division protein FtsW (lipid II flippase) [Paeniglutamicibacter cryotolerans]